ncbi:hypothetical protein Btru_075342 [Bulinus truncatus]|nr:hypothetical protein Btru_075342 [Bulinus truncatus]
MRSYTRSETLSAAPRAGASIHERPTLFKSATFHMGTKDVGSDDERSVDRTTAFSYFSNGTLSARSVLPNGISKKELNRYCSARFRSTVQDFPEAIKAMSKIRVTTYLPLVLMSDNSGTIAENTPPYQATPTSHHNKPHQQATTPTSYHNKPPQQATPTSHHNKPPQQATTTSHHNKLPQQATTISYSDKPHQQCTTPSHHNQPHQQTTPLRANLPTSHSSDFTQCQRTNKNHIKPKTDINMEAMN